MKLISVLLYNLLPMLPFEGPPLPRGLKLSEPGRPPSLDDSLEYIGLFLRKTKELEEKKGRRGQTLAEIASIDEEAKRELGF